MKAPKGGTNEDFMMIVVEKSVDRIETGRCWAAVNDGYIVAVVSMRPPRDVEMDTYRTHAIEALQVLGEVISGDVVEIDGKKVFCKRLSHKNRSKSSQTIRVPKMYQFLE
jgi:hypothetical protein